MCSSRSSRRCGVKGSGRRDERMLAETVLPATIETCRYSLSSLTQKLSIEPWENLSPDFRERAGAPVKRQCPHKLWPSSPTREFSLASSVQLHMSTLRRYEIL